MLIRPADALARLPGPPSELWPAGARSLSMFCCSEDFSTWVMFCGPQGGEQP